MREGGSGEESKVNEELEALPLPARFHISGSSLRNPVRQLAFSKGVYEGHLEKFEKKRVSGFRFRLVGGNSILIVGRKTSADLGNDPILLVPEAETAEDVRTQLEAEKGEWIFPKPVTSSELPSEKSKQACTNVIESWKGQFFFKEGTKGSDTEPATKGLRKPQIGALHAAIAHVSCSADAATIVMPTGTGKTETMLAVQVHQRFERLMVVVPTDALREQIAEKFQTLGVLKEQECVGPDAQFPVVLRLKHIPKSTQEVESLFSSANVIVTTMKIAGRANPDVQERMAQLSGGLFIDEAHHVSATTWRRFRSWFTESAGEKPIFQFTATPFREDGRKVDGKFIYYYPLAKAQQEDYFSEVEFRAVSEFEGDEADSELIRLLGDALDADTQSGLNHLAMARCHTISRAKKLHERYSAELGRFNPVIVHSQQSDSERRENLEKLKKFESRIIVCVDMLGEGFDLPELKIAVLHDVFKSVAATLQFVGRFTRPRPDLGRAKVIANTDQDQIDRALAKLYAEESDWNLLVATLSHERVGKALDRANLFEGFQGDLTEIPLQTLEPGMNAAVFTCPHCTRWDPFKLEDVLPEGSLIGMKVNERERIAVCILRHEKQAKWTKSSTATDVVWELVLCHWDESKGLLYLSSSGGAVSDSWSKAICGDETARIRDQEVFRCFYEFKQLVIRNLGMTHRQGGGTRYSQLMGEDVSDGIDSLKANERIQNNIFGSGFDEGEPRTLGCSIKGKFWSLARVHDLTDWIQWCHRIGELITNEQASTAAAFASAMRPTNITARPKAHPIVIHWPESLMSVYEERVAISFGDNEYPITECDIALANHASDGPLRFVVSSARDTAEFEINLGGGEASYPQVSGPETTIRTPQSTVPASEYFSDDSPQIDFGDGSFLIYSHHYTPPDTIDLKPLLDDKLIAWDWAGTDLSKEAQGAEKAANSIQYRVISELQKGDYDIILDDDGSGEFADVIAIRIRETVVEVLLCHCKYSTSQNPGSRVNDVYEVAGQALKSVRFCHKPKRFLRNLIKRERDRVAKGLPTRFEKGDKRDLMRLHSQWDQFRFEYRMWIVQPGISKKAISEPVMYVLAFVEKSLIEHRRIPLQVIMQA